MAEAEIQRGEVCVAQHPMGSIGFGQGLVCTSGIIRFQMVMPTSNGDSQLHVQELGKSSRNAFGFK